MIRYRFLSLLLVIIACPQVFSQPIQLKTILDATKNCRTPAAFTEFIKPLGFCFHEKKTMPSFTYYTHFKCGLTTIGQKDIRVNFSVSNDSSLNSSFLTKNKEWVDEYHKELDKYQFKETVQSSGEPRPNAKWFRSNEFPSVLILWEYNIDDKGEKVWHIGFVWNSPDN
jgi:hypothetical protein